MSSIDACMDKLEREGDEMFRVFTENLEKARERLGKCKYIRLVTPQACECQRVFDFDRSKLLLSTVDSSLNGRQLRYHAPGLRAGIFSSVLALGLFSFLSLSRNKKKH